MNLVEYKKRMQQGLFLLDQLPTSKPVSDIAVSSGWTELDELFRLYPGQFTICTGIAGHGKSSFILNLVARYAQLHGMKSLLFVPENEAHLRSKMQRIWGGAPGFDKFCTEQCFVQSSNSDLYNEPMDVTWLLKSADHAIRTNGIDLLLVDPWNEIEHLKPRELAMTDYIRDCLMLFKGLVRRTRVAMVLVVHPTKSVFQDGRARVPSLADCEGSMSWYNKADNALIVFRDLEKKATRIISPKVRERGAGRLGEAYFNFDIESEQFSPQYGAVSL